LGIFLAYQKGDEEGQCIEQDKQEKLR
jgi:hypothetical protein